MRTIYVLSIVSLAALGISASIGLADEEKIPLDKVPVPVLKAVKERFPRGELIEAAKETENGKTEYEVTLKLHGVQIDVMVSTEGKLTLIEKTMPAEDLPTPVMATVTAKYANNKITKAEEIFKVVDGTETLAYYEVIVQVEGKTIEAEIFPDGKLKQEEKKDEKKDK